MKWILDSSFRYTPSYATDVRKTFERLRREQALRNGDTVPSAEQAGEKVLRLNARKAAPK
jgi:hypothetical protein